MSPKVSLGFNFLGNAIHTSLDTKKSTLSTRITSNDFAPSLKLYTDKEVYRPGDVVTATIEIQNKHDLNGASAKEHSGVDTVVFLIENLSFEIKGIQKLDMQWFSMQKPLSGSKQRRGEQFFLDGTASSFVSKAVLSFGSTKTFIMRVKLPIVIPPSYRGTTIRYLYYIRSILNGRWLVLENGHSEGETTKDLIQLEDRTPLQIWVSRKTSALLTEEIDNDGFPSATIAQVDIYWKEKGMDAEWVIANEASEGVEEDYDSSKDEISSVSSYNVIKGNLVSAFGSSLSLQSYAPRLSTKETSYSQGEQCSYPHPHLSVTEVLNDVSEDILASQKNLSSYPSFVLSPKQPHRPQLFHSNSDNIGAPSTPGTSDPVSSEGFIRGRSYNIRMDDQVLLRFSPKNSESSYYFGDVIGGTLTFFHEGPRRCLEVSISLESSESIGQKFIHPSRRNSPTITKVHSEHYEVVADLVQTSFLFSIPIDGPMSFSVPHVSIHWALRFEFYTTPKNVNVLRYEHPLLIEGRDKGEWVLPITVHAPPPRTQASPSTNERPISLGALWVQP